MNRPAQQQVLLSYIYSTVGPLNTTYSIALTLLLFPPFFRRFVLSDHSLFGQHKYEPTSPTASTSELHFFYSGPFEHYVQHRAHIAPLFSLFSSFCVVSLVNTSMNRLAQQQVLLSYIYSTVGPLNTTYSIALTLHLFPLFFRRFA